jgi:hypothetical protein
MIACVMAGGFLLFMIGPSPSPLNASQVFAKSAYFILFHACYLSLT